MKSLESKIFRRLTLAAASLLLIAGCQGQDSERPAEPAPEPSASNSPVTAQVTEPSPAPTPDADEPTLRSLEASSAEELDAAEEAVARAEVLQERQLRLQEREVALQKREVALQEREAALADERRSLQEERTAPQAPVVDSPAPSPAGAPEPEIETEPAPAPEPEIEPEPEPEPEIVQSTDRPGLSDPSAGPEEEPVPHERWSDQAWRRGNRDAEESTAADAPTEPTEPTEPRTATLRAGTVLTLGVESELSSRASRVGEEFSMRVTEDVRDEEGRVVVPEGTTVLGFVTEAKPLRRVGGRAALGLEFDRLVLPNGEEVEVRASLLQQGRNKKRDKLKIAGATIAGAILGQILGGDSEATATGAAVGAAASTAAVMRVKGEDIELPAGTELEIELVEVVTWTSRYLGVVES